MIPLHARQKFYLTTGGVFLFLLLFLFLAVFPRFRALSGGFRDVQNARRERQVLELKLSSLATFTKRMREFDRTFQRLQEEMFVDSEAPIDFVQFLEGMAVERGLQIKLISAAPTTGKTFGKALLFEVELAGAGSEVLRFLTKLEKAPYFIEIQRFQLQAIKGQEGESPKTLPSGFVSGRVLLLVYAR